MEWNRARSSIEHARNAIVLLHTTQRRRSQGQYSSALTHAHHVVVARSTTMALRYRACPSPTCRLLDNAWECHESRRGAVCVADSAPGCPPVAGRDRMGKGDESGRN